MKSKKTPKERLLECISIHGDRYDYKYSVFKTGKDNIDILCHSHGIFTQRLYHHLNGSGCPVCSGNLPERRGKYIDNGDGTALIPLTKGKFALVDVEDVPKLIKYVWHYSQDGYACAYDKLKRNIIRMHRILMTCPKKYEIDHIDNNKINNRKSNLRKCTRSQNNRNTSKRSHSSNNYKGVRYNNNKTKFVARITFNKNQIHLGTFDTEIEAVKAYDNACRKYDKNFFRTNF